MKGRIVVFGGTTEGRQLAEILGNGGVDTLVCVSTEFGKGLVHECGSVKVSSDRLGEEGLRRVVGEGCAAVIDATHPYAVHMSEKARAMCKELGVEYIRLLRPNGMSCSDSDAMTFADIDEAVEYIKCQTGNVLVTTGSKEIAKYASIENYRDRIFCRVLSAPGVADACSKAGFDGKNLFCMQGPFCEDLDYGMLKQVNASFMVTKDSGPQGGFDEKVRAAERAGVKLLIVGRPPEENGITFGQVVERISEISGKELGSASALGKRRITVVGIGMGDGGTMTVSAERAIRDADMLFGAERMISSVSGPAPRIAEYRAEEIVKYLDANAEIFNSVVLVSGDTGFYSAAKGISGAAGERYDVEIVCGISSVSYLCSRIGTSWNDAYLMSAHGSDSNIVGNVMRHRKVISLMNGGESVNRLCSDLERYGLGDVIMTVGQDLGQADECIVSGIPKGIGSGTFGKLCIVMIINDCADSSVPIGIPDEDFVRGDAPMTKSEVRSLSVVKLKLRDDSIVFDIGAGTGSVSVEAALTAVNGRVYAIEKESSAVELIRRNAEKMGAWNVEAVEGTAPEALDGLPVPTHVFVGGSSGNMGTILRKVLDMNPKVRIVINAVTIETLSEATECIGRLGLKEESIVSVSIANARKAGRYHLMTAQNPVYIITCSGI